MFPSNRKWAKRVKSAQLAWASNRPFPVNAAGYFQLPDHNLLQPLDPETRTELNSGDGAELGKNGKRGKFCALHSSSALACNFFDFWRRQPDKRPLALALGLEPSAHIDGLAFEVKFATGVGPRSPNLDVVLQLSEGILAIESKFLEAYGSPHDKKIMAEKYFEGGRRRWSEVGLEGAQALAERFRAKHLSQDGRHSPEIAFSHLDATQLLKHMLGLGKQSQNWSLLYLWYDVDHKARLSHEEEVSRFVSLLGVDSRKFSSTSYGEAFARLSASAGENHKEYMNYLRDRYFAGVQSTG